MTPDEADYFVVRARTKLDSARALAGTDPETALTVAYAAVRVACEGLLARQGLRATQAGGHLAVEETVRAQFGDGFAPYAWLRRRRHDLDYARRPHDVPEDREVEEAIETAERLVTAAEALMPTLGVF